MGNGEILPGVTTSLRKHSLRCSRRRVDRPWFIATAPRRRSLSSSPTRSRS